MSRQDALFLLSFRDSPPYTEDQFALLFFSSATFVELPLVAFMRVQILSPILRFLLGPSCLFPPLLPMSSPSEVNRKPPTACFVLKICIGQFACLSSFPSFSNFIKMPLGWHFSRLFCQASKLERYFRQTDVILRAIFLALAY